MNTFSSLFVFIFFILPISTHSQITVNPKLTLVSNRAFYASYFEKDVKGGRGSFAPFKEIVDSKKNCTFKFYDDYIAINTLNIIIDLLIEKADIYTNAQVYQVKDRFGKKYVITVEYSESDDVSFSIAERDMINDYKRLTMYICKKV